MADVSRLVNIKILFQWDGSNWTDETAYLDSAKGTYEYFPAHESYQSSKLIIQQATVVLENRNHRFSPWHTSSVLYAYRSRAGAYRRKCKIQVQINGGSWQDVFVGYVKAPGEAYGRGQTSFTIWDAGEIMRDKYSTEMLAGYLEHDLVKHYLQLAGLVDGIDFVSPGYATAHGVTATIDYSASRIPYSWLDDEPVWDELADVAQATGARLYIGPEGRVYYKKGWQWSLLGSGTAEVISELHARDFDFAYDDKAFYGEIVVDFTQRMPSVSDEELWTLDNAKVIAPGKTEVVVARYRHPAINVVAPEPNVHYWLRTMAGQDATLSGEFIPTFEIRGQQTKITIINSSATTGLILTKAKLIGQPLVGQPSEQVTAVANADFTRTLEVRSNPYVQTEPQAKAIADFLAWWYGASKLSLRIRGLPGKPDRTLGTRIQTTLDGITFDGIVVRIQWQISAKERAWVYTHEVSCIENQFGGGNYFTIGVDSVSSGKGVWH